MATHPGQIPESGESHPPSNPGLRRLIRSKREFSNAPSEHAAALGFRGWHSRGYLPHFDAPNVTQLVTINLANAFPVERRVEWEPILNLSDTSETRRKLEELLDRGLGACWLRRSEVASIVETRLLEDNGRGYKLIAWVTMPNHAHILVNVWRTPLSKLIKLWKGFTAVASNRVLGRHGKFWQEDYWDTLIKNDRHLQQAIRYVENNPTKAKLVLDSKCWQWSSARRRDNFGKLAD